jgi:hypothetical protein
LNGGTSADEINSWPAFQTNPRTSALNPSSHNSQNPANVTTTGIKDFVLDLAASPLGYDISRIVSFSGWLDARAGQSYSIFFKAVGSSEFTQITPGGSGIDAVSVAAKNRTCS